ncbi:MAG: ACP S-malonyltransferase [Treponema sp.]|jgi:[acyl-carrier-protein] S-malonyltransferase|nr:ACP S-malonyltransferase [Treponema sp.]
MVEKKVIFLFPGQGAQYPGMGLDFAELSADAKKVFDTASQIMGRDMIALIRDSDAETLKQTDYSQPAICTASLAAMVFLKEQGTVPIACAGFSLGEYPALYCAGILSMEDCFRLTDARGRAMQAAIEKIKAGFMGDPGEAPGMAAVIGLDPGQVEALMAEWKNSGLKDLYAANFNSSKQTAVSGTAEALTEAETRFKEAGAKRFLRLQVAGPFHSPLMKEAAEAFAPELDKVQFRDPAIMIFSNVTGKQINSGEEAKALALRQIVEALRWTDEEAELAALQPEALLEAGPGKVLQGLWRDTGNAVPCYAAGTAAEILELKKNISQGNNLSNQETK